MFLKRRNDSLSERLFKVSYMFMILNVHSLDGAKLVRLDLVVVVLALLKWPR